jgi:F-type H+-transporting ATPase subunit delta
MGSATTQALAASTQALAAASGVSIDTARELFAAARAVGDSSHLSGALADPSAPVEARQAVVSAVFGGYSQSAQSVLRTVVAERW